MVIANVFFNSIIGRPVLLKKVAISKLPASTRKDMSNLEKIICNAFFYKLLQQCTNSHLSNLQI